MVKKTIKKITPESAKEEVADSDQKPARKRGCSFCQSKHLPSYQDLVTLKRYLSERGKILPKTYTRLCSKHQRGVTKHIKYARHLALLPFTPKV